MLNAERDRFKFSYWDMIHITREALQDVTDAKRSGDIERIQEAEKDLESWKTRLIAAYGEAAWNKV